MVLEHLFPEDWLEKKVGYAFLIAIVYSSLGIIVARLLFGANSGIVSAMFTSILILPYLNKLFKKEEEKEEKEKKFSLKELYVDNKTSIKVYFSIFLGIYLTYAIYSFLLPQLGFNTFSFFKEQLFVDPALRGRAFDSGTFLAIFTNNWWVLLACFLLALVTGDGAVFFITWNASAWGTIFGFRALTAAQYSGESSIIILLTILVITFPHLILEGGAYILAAVSGSVISDEIIKRGDEIKQFILYLVLIAMGFWFFSFFWKNVFSNKSEIPFGIVSILLIVPAIHLIGRLFKDKKYQEVFVYNYYLFIIALIIFALGAIVETFVLGSSFRLQEIYAYAFAAMLT